MSLWDWLLAAWIYEELFDDDSDNSLPDNTCYHDSFHNHVYNDDFEDGFY